MNGSVLIQVFVLFAFLAVGFIINKLGILDEHANGKISSLLLNVIIPCAILDAALSQDHIGTGIILKVTAIATGIFIVMSVASKYLTKAFKMEKTYQLMFNYSNLGFMGLPIVTAFYGTKYGVYVAIFMMMFGLFMFSVGIITLQGSLEGPKVMIKKLITPGIISSIIAFVLIIIPNVPYPTPLEIFLSGIGSINSPLAMIVIGSQLGTTSIKDSFRTGKLYLMALFKLIIYPALVYLILVLIMGPCIEVNIATILIGLPVAANVTMISSEYGGNVKLAAEGTCLTTVLCLITVPIMLMLLG